MEIYRNEFYENLKNLEYPSVDEVSIDRVLQSDHRMRFLIWSLEKIYQEIKIEVDSFEDCLVSGGYCDSASTAKRFFNCDNSLSQEQEIKIFKRLIFMLRVKQAEPDLEETPDSNITDMLECTPLATSSISEDSNKTDKLPDIPIPPPTSLEDDKDDTTNVPIENHEALKVSAERFVTIMDRTWKAEPASTRMERGEFDDLVAQCSEMSETLRGIDENLGKILKEPTCRVVEELFKDTSEIDENLKRLVVLTIDLKESHK